MDEQTDSATPPPPRFKRGQPVAIVLRGTDQAVRITKIAAVNTASVRTVDWSPFNDTTWTFNGDVWQGFHRRAKPHSTYRLREVRGGDEEAAEQFQLSRRIGKTEWSKLSLSTLRAVAAAIAADPATQREG